MFKNYFKEEEYYIEGSLFPSEFTLGFELEAWADDWNRKDNFSRWARDYWENLSGEGNIDNSTMNMGYDPTIQPNDGESVCPDCGGDGRFTCDYCGGDGWINCDECSGSGINKEVCENCNGSGEIEEQCPKCDGYAEIDVRNIDGNVEKETCPECNGDGTITETCPECGGDGEVEEECRECDGEGRRECPQCYGEGYWDCDYCGGSGEVREDERTYEWSSPVFKVTPLSLQQIITFLINGIDDGYINTNDSCGFHMHLGFPIKKTKNFDMFWVLICIAFDLKKYEDILNFNRIRLENYNYASPDFLQGIRKDLNNITLDAKINDNVNEIELGLNVFIQRYYRDEKFRTIRIHPQGTFEWRGARGFMDDQRVEEIKAFIFKKFYPFVKWITDKLDEEFIIVNGVKIERSFIEELASKVRSPSYVKDFKEIHGSKFNNKQIMRILPIIYKKNPWLKKCKFEDAILEINKDFEILYMNGDFKKGYYKGVIDNDNRSTYSAFFNGTTFEGKIINSDGQFREGAQIINSKFYNTFELDYMRSSAMPITILNSEGYNVEFRGMDYLIINGGNYTECKFKDTIINSGRFVNCTWNNSNYDNFKGGEWINGIIIDDTTGEEVQSDLNPKEYKAMKIRVQAMPHVGERDLDKIPEQEEGERWIDYLNRIKELR